MTGGIVLRRNCQVGFNRIAGFGLNLFSEDELYAIHCAILEILHYTGLKVESKEAQDIFYSNGCYVDRQKNIVKIPPHVVEDAIRSAPSTFFLAGRDPKNDYVVGDKGSAFFNFGEALNIYDPFTMEYRKTTKKDVGNAALVCDAIEEMDICNRAVGSDEYPGQMQSLHNAEAIFNNTTKHCFIGPNSGYNYKKIVEMASAIQGGMDKLRERPIYSATVCPTSPLQLTPEMSDVVVEAARAVLPVNIVSMAMAGASAPVTLAGTLVTQGAEVLGGIVLNQLTHKGAPVTFGAVSTIMDLRIATAPVGAPELGMLSVAMAELAKYYLIPSFGAGG